MNLLPSANDYMYQRDPHGICVIVPQGKITASIAAEIAEHTMTHIVQYGLPLGLMIDVRHNRLLSIVRLSNLLDTLTGLGMPVTVVFMSDDQKHLASLLHNTLTHKKSVTYFTDRARAMAYLLNDATRDQTVFS